MDPQEQQQNGILGLLEEMKGKMRSIGPKLRSFLDRKQAQSQKIKSMLNDINQMLDSLDFKEIKQNKDKIMALTKQLEEANKRINQLDAENANLRDSLQSAEMQIAELQKEINRLTEEHRAQIEKLNQDHTQEINRLNEEHAAAINALNQQIQALQQQVTELTNQVITLTNERDRIEQSVNELNDMLNEQLDLIEGYLREIEMDAENENVLTTILTKLNAIRMELNQPASNPNMPPPPPQQQSKRDKNYDAYRSQLQMITPIPRTVPATFEEWSPEDKSQINKLVGIVPYFKDSKGQIQYLNSFMGEDDYEIFKVYYPQYLGYWGLITRGGKRKTKRHSKRVAKRYSKKNYKKNYKKALKGGWVYKGDPHLDSESSVITDSMSKSKSKSKSISKSNSKSKSNKTNSKKRMNKTETKKRSKM